MSKDLYVLFLLCIALICSAATAQAEVLQVSYSEGAPMIVRGGAEIAAVPGTLCQANDVLKTTPVCKLDIAINGQAGCRLLASSEVLIADATDQTTLLKLVNGNVVLNVDKLPKESEFRIETPTAVAAVRGTQFWGRVDGVQTGSPVTTFAVREGAVEILAKGSGQTYRIEQGQALDIPADVSALPVIRPALAEELAAMEQASAIKTSA